MVPVHGKSPISPSPAGPGPVFGTQGLSLPGGSLAVPLLALFSLLSAILVPPATPATASELLWNFDWGTRTDRNGKPAGFFALSPFPIDGTGTTYTLVNDEGPTTYNLGTIYFVDGAKVSSTGDGRTLGGAKRTIGAAISAAGPGNKTIIVRGAHGSFSGVYLEHSLRLNSGVDPTHRFSVIGYGQERPVIDGSGGTSDVAVITSAPNSTLQRLEIRNSYDGGVRSGGGYNNFIDLHIHDIGSNAGEAALQNETSDYSLVFHCTAARTRNHAYKISDNSSYCTVEWSIAENVAYFDNADMSRAWHCLAVDLVSHPSAGHYGRNNTVRYCIVRDCYSYALNLEGQINPSIHHNEFANAMRVYDVNPNAEAWVANGTEGSYAIEAQEFYSGEFHSNVVRDSRAVASATNHHGLMQVGWGGHSASYFTAGTVNIYNNIFYQSAANTLQNLFEWHPTGDTVAGVTYNLFNNTFYADTSPIDNHDTLLDNVSVGYRTGTVKVRNNILQQAGTGSGWKLQTADLHQDNIVFSPSGSAGHLLDPTDKAVDPKLVVPWGPFVLGLGETQAGSPARDTGLDLTPFFTSFNGLSRPQGAGWDIGAYESALPGTGGIRPAPPTNVRLLP